MGLFAIALSNAIMPPTSSQVYDMLHEYVGNIHLHTIHSDGHASHEEIAAIAQRAGLDFVMPTDHNIYVPGKDGWYGDTLLLVGEEIHDVHREPQANHFLVFNVGEELVQYAQHPQALIDAVNERDGLGFVAHPFEHSGAYSREPEINWVTWEVTGFTGLSIWNYMSEFKSYLHDAPTSVFAALFPQAVIRGPYPETLRKWDDLLSQRKMPVLCSSDAHASTYHMGPLSRVVLPYEYVFRTVNMHILAREAFNGTLGHDAALVYEALRRGCGFVAYDGIGQAKGFRFDASTSLGKATMGDELCMSGQVELTVSTPLPADIRLLRNGETVARARGRELRYVTDVPGPYRAEAYRQYWFRTRGWIFSNAVYLTRD
ncbi:MAG: hypothetical protein AMJ93_04835 [Anaerolineae bacterium SM23_84]|nr:MAG: hypothetical protein AMJ93_04835 [Anaerolineae bacterium SM23_84]